MSGKQSRREEKIIISDKEGYSITKIDSFIKNTILSIHESSNTTSKFSKEKLIELKNRQIHKDSEI